MKPDLSKVPDSVLKMQILERSYDGSVSLQERLEAILYNNGQLELEEVFFQVEKKEKWVDGSEGIKIEEEVLIAFDAWTKDLVITLTQTMFGDIDLRAYYRNPPKRT